MKKHTKNKVFALLLAVIMLIGTWSTTAVAVEEEFKVVVSIEGATLGQGLYVEPKAYTLNEINTLVATEGFGPYTEDSLTAGIATLAMLIDNKLEYTMTGSWDSDAYLSSIKDIDKGSVDIPAIVSDNGGPANDSHDGNSDNYLGEFDYSFMSGWMITVNDFMITMGCAQWDMKNKIAEGSQGVDYGNTYVIRWQFTTYGYGADLGIDTGWGMPAYFEHANKDALYTAYALSDDNTAKAAALPIMEKLTATQAEVDKALELFESKEEPEARTAQDVDTTLNATMAQLATTVTAPTFGTSAGEWSVMDLARGNYYTKDNKYFSDYYNRIVTTVNETAASVNKDGALHKVKSTENSRLILALSSIGKDAAKVGDWNLITPYEDFSWIKKQGINGPIFALIALDTHNYQTTDTTIRQQCIDYILGKELSAGGWALSGKNPDPDITAMALQALVNYSSQPEVAEAANKAFAWLSSAQQENGGYASWGTVNSESIAQVIVACTAWGINPDTDTRFVKTNGSAVDALLAFYDAAAKAFKHTADGEINGMATDQACYALVAYDRFLKEKTSLYDMSDVVFDNHDSQEDSVSAMLGLPDKIEGDFNATISVNKWDNEGAYKLIDLIVTVPNGLSVTDVTPGNKLSGGTISWNLEKATGKLRIVYFDANNNSDLIITGSEFPAELFTVSFKPEDLTADSELTIAISGMSIKCNSDSASEDAMVVVDTSEVTGTVTFVVGVSYSAITLYTGDDVDIIPATKKAVAVAVTGTQAQNELLYNDGTHNISFLYSEEFSSKSGIPTYVALVDASIAMENFVDKNNFTISDAVAENLKFGDTNNDGVVNAQDALAAVDCWLRKGKAPTNHEILALNVNGDTRINTFDALGIVEAFINGTDYAVVTKASLLSTNP